MQFDRRLARAKDGSVVLIECGHIDRRPGGQIPQVFWNGPAIEALSVGVQFTMALQDPQFLTVVETDPEIDDSLGLGIGYDERTFAVRNNGGVGFEIVAPQKNLK